MALSEKSVQENTATMRDRYGRMTGKRARSWVIEEYVAVRSFERTYAIKALRCSRRPGETAGSGGVPKHYGEPMDIRLRELRMG